MAQERELSKMSVDELVSLNQKLGAETDRLRVQRQTINKLIAEKIATRGAGSKER